MRNSEVLKLNKLRMFKKVFEDFVNKKIDFVISWENGCKATLITKTMNTKRSLYYKNVFQIEIEFNSIVLILL